MRERELFKKLPGPRELEELARKAGHDSLGVGGDPELLVPLVNAARRRAFRERTAQAFDDWIRLLRECAEGVAARPTEPQGTAEPAEAVWLETEAIGVAVAARHARGFAEPGWVAELRQRAEAAFSKTRREEITRRFEFEWSETEVKAGR